MKLRKPCEHKDEAHPEGRYEPHWGPCRFEECQGEPDHVKCPGGVFLPDDTLIIEKVIVDRQALAEALEMLYEPDLDDQGRNTTPVRYPLDVIGTAAGLILGALSVREAEPEVEKNQMGMW